MTTVTVLREGRPEQASGRTLDSIARRVFGRSAELRREHSPEFEPAVTTWTVCRTDRYGTHVEGRIVAPADSPRS